MPAEKYFFIDPNQCIGCQWRFAAWSECDAHKAHSDSDSEFDTGAPSLESLPVGRVHCDTPTCAEVCPADAIKRTGDGVVQTARKPRCIACNNCVLACPFGVPKMNVGFELMMKCDMCYDRTSVGKNPMCATVCPSRALHYGTWEEIEEMRPRSTPHNKFLFGKQEVRTKDYMMVPRAAEPEYVDVLAVLAEGSADPGNEPTDDDPMLVNLFGNHGG